MCGPARLSSDVSEIKIAFGIPPERSAPNFPPSWNVAPTDPLPVVRYEREQPRPDALGPDPLLGQGYQDRLLDLQRAGRGDRHQAGPSARRSGSGAAWYRSTAFTNGRKPRRASSPIRSA